MKRLLFSLLLLVWAGAASSLPLYTAREGRTCDNCHTLPNYWKNPKDAKDRKCTLSCSACHVDPTGGGLRTTPGRFYGESSLSMGFATHRGYKDQGRYLAAFLQNTEEHPTEDSEYQSAKSALSEVQQKFSLVKQSNADAQTKLDEATSAQARAQEGLDASLKKITELEAASLINSPEYAQAVVARDNARAALDQATATTEAAKAERDKQQGLLDEAKRGYADTYQRLLLAKSARQDAQNWVPRLAFGEPKGDTPAMAFDQSRYAGLEADPLLSIGIDLRLASWTVFATEPRALFFPMQFDTQAALHPAEHFSAYVNAGVLAKEKGFAATATRQNPYAVKDAFVLYNELPYNAYVKVGRFVPAFGTRLDDHTSFTRRDFELDQGIQESRVFGAEVGFAPNYPYANISVFRPGERDSFSAADPNNDEPPSFLGVGGVGAAASAGYRELGWQAGGSAMIRRRDLTDGGDTLSASVQWGLNPWLYFDKIPVTLMGELAVGTLQREFSGSKALQKAAFQELDYQPANGVNLRLKYDFDDPDAAVKDDQQNRVSLGADLTILPGLRLSGMGRLTFIPGAEAALPDVFVYLRGWL